MKVALLEAGSGKKLEAIITEAMQKDIPSRKDGWQFTWKKLFKTERALFFRIAAIERPGQTEGLLMLSLINEELLYMNAIEVAPHNFGSAGRYENVAGCLLGYACYKSFELGKGPYLGFLSFDSKTRLIELYEKKYGATFAMGQKMFFDPNAGKELMKKYLNTG